MGDFNLYRRFRNVDTGRVSTSFLSVCKDNKILTLRNGYISKAMDDIDTPFYEIESVPYEQCFPKHHKELFIPRKREVVSFDESVSTQYRLLREYIINKWDATKYNVIFHSSGYDSRIISIILRELYEAKHPLGDFVFLCHNPEGEYFKNVMKAEGWGPEHWTVNPGQNAESFDFSKSWQFLNGPSEFPVCPESSFFYKFYGSRRDHLDNFRFWFGSFGNEVFYHIIRNNKTFQDMCDIYYYSRYARLFSNFNPDNIRTPFLDPRRIEYVLRTSVSALPSEECIFKTTLMEENKLAPRLKGIPVFPPEELSKTWCCPESIYPKAVNDYEASWYYQTVGDDGYRDRYYGKTADQNRWWSDWTLASLCDELIRQGIEIKYTAKRIKSLPQKIETKQVETPEEFWNRHTVHDQPFTTMEESEAYNAWLYDNYKMSRELLMLDENWKGWFVLDYGCGPGNDTIEFAKAGANVLAVDISDKALTLAADRVKLYDFKSVVFKRIGTDGRVMKINECVDHIHCNGVIHHIPDPRPQIAEMYRLLKPGGYATIMTYNRESIYYHLYVAYVLRFLSGRQSGMALSDDFMPDMSVDKVFSLATDGKDCPFSKAYGPEFMDLLHDTVTCGGAFYCSIDMKPFFDKFYRMAIREPELDHEHKVFLGSIEWRGDLPYKDGMPCGALSVYHMAKTSRWG